MNKFVLIAFLACVFVGLSAAIPLSEKQSPTVAEFNPAAVGSDLSQDAPLEDEGELLREKRHHHHHYGGYGRGFGGYGGYGGGFGYGRGYGGYGGYGFYG